MVTYIIGKYTCYFTQAGMGVSRWYQGRYDKAMSYYIYHIFSRFSWEKVEDTWGVITSLIRRDDNDFHHVLDQHA